MGLGVLDVSSAHVPGTSTLLEKRLQTTPEAPEAVLATSHLKYDHSGSHPILLVPQPTDDPDDPLTWPLLRRDLILIAMSLLSVIATTLSPILAANSLYLAEYFPRQIGDITVLTGYQLLGVAVGAVLCVPSAQIWGKRHLYLLGTIVIVLSCAWGGASNHNYKSFLWARLFQGIGLAPFETLVNASVADMYFVHQRGKRMALSNLALFGGAFFTPVIVGKMTSTIGWQWSFYFVAIFEGVLLFVVVFFIPETAYRRPEHLKIDIQQVLATESASTSSENGAVELQKVALEETSAEAALDHDSPSVQKEATTIETAATSPPAPRRPHSYWRSLRPFNGRKSDESYFKLLLRPFPLFLQPGVLWACLTQGTLIGWTVLLGLNLAAIMLAAPLFYSEVQTGYMYSGPFIGAIGGFLVSGVLADSSTRLLARWNNGVYEPEFKLVLVIPQLVFGCAGLYGFGLTAADPYRYRWIGPVIFFGLEVAGMVCGAVVSALYIVDAHRDITIEAFTCIIMFKNIFSFALTFPGYDWLLALGPRKLFIIIGSVQVGLCLLSIPMYIFGKWNRHFFAQHDMLAKLGLR